MTRRGFKLGLLAVAALAGGGCTGNVYPPVRLDTAGVTPRADYSDLGAVLESAFDRKGKVIPAMVALRAGRLEAQLKRLAVTGPTATPKLFPTPESRLAYWYNARAAWSLKLAAIEEFPERTPAAALGQRAVPLDGRTMTLADIDVILAADADWRTVVASPGALVARARLPKQPFSRRDIRRRVAQRFEQFIDDDTRLVIDVKRKQILFPPVLWQFRGKLIADYHRRYATGGATLTTALLPHVGGSAERRLQNAVGYACAPARADGCIDCSTTD